MIIKIGLIFDAFLLHTFIKWKKKISFPSKKNITLVLCMNNDRNVRKNYRRPRKFLLVCSVRNKRLGAFPIRIHMESALRSRVRLEKRVCDTCEGQMIVNGRNEAWIGARRGEQRFWPRCLLMVQWVQRESEAEESSWCHARQRNKETVYEYQVLNVRGIIVVWSRIRLSSIKRELSVCKCWKVMLPLCVFCDVWSTIRLPKIFVNYNYRIDQESQENRHSVALATV